MIRFPRAPISRTTSASPSALTEGPTMSCNGTRLPGRARVPPRAAPPSSEAAGRSPPATADHIAASFQQQKHSSSLRRARDGHIAAGTAASTRTGRSAPALRRRWSDCDCRSALGCQRPMHCRWPGAGDLDTGSAYEGSASSS